MKRAYLFRFIALVSAQKRANFLQLQTLRILQYYNIDVRLWPIVWLLF